MGEQAMGSGRKRYANFPLRAARSPYFSPFGSIDYGCPAQGSGSYERRMETLEVALVAIQGVEALMYGRLEVACYRNDPALCHRAQQSHQRCAVKGKSDQKGGLMLHI